MLSREEMVGKLRQTIKPGRFSHTMGVVSTAEELAELFGADTQKCSIAALLHDCAKSMSVQEMLDIIDEQGIELLCGEKEVEPILHAPAGAALAQKVYGVTDGEILSAIRKHTVGGHDMTLVEAIVFVADFIEPGRKEFEGLAEVRQLARKDIYTAAKECARLTEEYCKANGQPVFCAV